MRGRRDLTGDDAGLLWTWKERVPKDHPIRTIKTVADEVLDRLWLGSDRMYSKVGLGCQARRDNRACGGRTLSDATETFTLLHHVGVVVRGLLEIHS